MDAPSTDPHWLGWTAGIIDGEGCIRLQKNHGIVLAVGNTEISMLLKLRDIWGGNIYVNRHAYKNAKPFHQWQACGLHAIKVLECVLPFLVVKRERAEIVIGLKGIVGKKDRYRPWKNEEWRKQRQAARETLTAMNQRGTVQ